MSTKIPLDIQTVFSLLVLYVCYLTVLLRKKKSEVVKCWVYEFIDMYMLELDKQCLVKEVLLDSLKNLGVRCRFPKKFKEHEKENLYFPEYQVFQKPLHLLKSCSVPRLNGTTIEVPEFLADACAVIERGIKTEGIFRRAGSTGKQRESKMLINQGNKVNFDYNVFDACSLVKLFFRELPQPLIPPMFQDMMMRCLLLHCEQNQVEAMMLVCLLMPPVNLRTLAYFMEFLLKVSKYSEFNKMSKKNLAIILTPTLISSKKQRSSDNVDMTNHFKCLELLIEHSEKIGIIPEHIDESLTTDKLKKKKRSGSLTRMFTGLKKIVGNKSLNTPDCNESTVSTPGSLSSRGKRKSSENNHASIAPKKKYIQNVLPDGALFATPLRCRMHGYVTPILPSRERMVPYNLKKADSESPPRKSRRHNSKSMKHEKETCGTNIVRRCLTKKEVSLPTMNSSNSVHNLFSLENTKTSLDRKLSIISWGRKKHVSNSCLNKSDLDYQEECSDITFNSLNDSELITVHKSEYEDIKNRVIALEEELEILNATHSIQSAYEKTLEESEKINLESADDLARKLSNDLKIRNSLENKIIRSPSARKIGSIRRRSKESFHKNFEPKTSLRRGRPNTLQSGLPSPRSLRCVNNSESIIGSWKSPLESPVLLRDMPETLDQPDWQSGDTFFARDYLLQKLLPVPQGRPSVVEIRNQNAGMVLEKAKLFNALNEAERDSKDMKVERRQSIRIENLRRKKEMDNKREEIVICGNSLKSEKSSEVNSVNITELRDILHNNITGQFEKNNDCRSTVSVTHKKRTPQMNAMLNDISEVDSSKRPTPNIKKCLSTRSPRRIVKTPLNHVKTTLRPRITPVRTLLDPYSTPRIGIRRSPRILARSLTSPT